MSFLVAVAGISLFGWLPEPARVREIVLHDIRIPRLIVGALAGFALGVAGLLVQSALRNRLAVPDLFGVNGGAALVMAFAVTHNLGDATTRPAIALLGAFAGGALCLAVASRAPTPTQTLLVGAAVSIGLQGAVLSVSATADQIQLALIYRYLVGSLSSVTADTATSMVWPIVVALVLSIVVTPALGVLGLGDASAGSLGVDPRRWRLVVLLVAAVLVAVVVAPVGPLSWVSLLAPTLSRWSSPDLDPRVRPLHVGTLGAGLTVAADLAARQVFSPFETPVGAWTSLAGIIVAAALLRHHPEDTR
jgi:iron complex transport system permease protein